MTARRVVVGGASSGLGAAIAEAFAAQGAELVIWSRSAERIEAKASELRERHQAIVHPVAADAADPEAAPTVAARCLELLGGVDVAVLNAGGPPPCAADQTTAKGWQAAFQLLAITPIDLATRLLPGMRSQGFGRVIAVLSSGVREPIPNLGYSNAGRAALAAWLKTAARDIAADGVTVNGVLPGRIDTDRVASLDAAAAKREGIDVAEARRRSIATIPAGRYGRPEEFARVVTFLAEDGAGFVNGSLLSCDGAMMRSIG